MQIEFVEMVLTVSLMSEIETVVDEFSVVTS
jgi:hypothetical protein